MFIVELDCGIRTKWNITLISSTWSHKQRKTLRLEKNAAYVGLKMSTKKTKVMRINARKIPQRSPEKR